MYTRIGPKLPDWNTLTSFNRIISSSARNVTIRLARSCASANSSSNPQAWVSDSRVEQLVDAGLDRHLLGRKHHPRPLLGALNDRLERGQQAEEIDFELRLDILAGDPGDAFVRPLPLRSAHLLALVQQPGGGLVLLVLEQPLHQRVARVFLFALDRQPRSRAGAAASWT